MSVFRSYFAVFLCVVLPGCAAFLEVLTAPINTTPSTSAAPIKTPPPQKSSPALPVHLNFRILNARAQISGRDYIMDSTTRPIITALGENTYQLELTLRRDSNSSLRGDETVITHFYYDGVELLFFGDLNGNQRLDRREPSMRHIISHTQEVISEGNKHYLQPLHLTITLNRQHFRTWQRIGNVELQLIFIESP